MAKIPIVVTDSKAVCPYIIETRQTESWNAHSCWKHLDTAEAVTRLIRQDYPHLPVRIHYHAGGPPQIGQYINQKVALMFGLSIKEKHDGYIGHRAIFYRGFVDILPDRGSRHGSAESVDRVIAWANKERKLPPPPGKKRPRKITPWKQMLEEAPKKLSSSSRDDWEIREENFVLRCNPNASYGYLYVALFEELPELQHA